MFFSISIPVYNAAKYLDECILSILNQTEKDYEIILVDDGSSDNSVNICEKWLKKYPEIIRVIKKENSGSLFTRRRCLEESRGKYIYIMDADDYLLSKDMLKELKTKIVDTGCDMVFFNCSIQPDNIKPYFEFPFVDGTVFENEKLLDIYQYYILENGLKPLWNKIFSRNLVDWDADYSKYNNITNGTDYFQSTTIINNAKKILYCKNVYYYYRVVNNNQSIVHSFKPTVFYSAKENYFRLEKCAKEWIPDNVKLDNMLCTEYMKLISTSIYKVRLLSKSDDKYRKEYLSSIGNDEVFRQKYSLKLTRGFGRKLLVFLLYHKQYSIISTLLKMI